MKAGDCKHFNGVLNDCCDAGVNYKQLSLTFKGMPCLSKPDVVRLMVVCSKFEAYTKEDEQADELQASESISRVLKAIAAIKEKHGASKPAETVVEKMPCPCCTSGTLHYQISSYNGHRSGKCTTDGCVSWIE